MDSDTTKIAQNVSLHLYNNVVFGVANVSSKASMKAIAKSSKSRLADLQPLYESLGVDGRRMFYAAVVAIAEFAVFRTIDFIETYNRFESHDNEDDIPSLSLLYRTPSADGVKEIRLTEFGADRLSILFKEIARSDEIRALADSAIEQLAKP